MDIKVDVDMGHLNTALQVAGKKTRWLVTLALTRTAFAARAPLADSAESQFHDRGSGWMRRGIRAERATIQSLTSRVGTVSEVMEDLVTGGERHATGRIPTQIIRGNKRLTSRSSVEALLRSRTKPRAFVAKVAEPKGVWRRTGKGRYPVETLWNFPKATPKMQAAWKMAAVVAMSIRRPGKGGFTWEFLKAFREMLEKGR